MSTLDQDTNERRRYYRIDDWVALEILPESQGPSSGPMLEILNEFNQLEFDSQPLLRQIAENDRGLANFLRMQSRRLDLLARILVQDMVKQIGQPRRVNLSEAGIRFPNTEPLPPNSRATVRLLLLPNPVELILHISILRCHQQDTGRYEIAANFEGITDLQRQQLARHILQKQAVERRKAREDEHP